MNPRSISATLLVTLAFWAGILGCSSDASDNDAGGTSASTNAGPGSGAGSGVGPAGSGGAGGDVRSGGGDGGAGSPGASSGGGGDDEGGGGAGGPGDPSGAGSGGAPSGEGGAGGPGASSGGEGGGADSTAYIGRECAAHPDCGPSGYCFASSSNDFFDGGPAGGYCTMECDTDADCGGESNICAGGLCLLGCTLGTPLLNYLDDDLLPGKCHGREDLRCEAIGDVTICLPGCGMDSQCDGRVCNRQSGVCSDEPTTGLPDGARCNPTSEDAEPCASWCIGFSDEVGVCTGTCTLGGDIANEDCGGLEHGVCIYALLAEPAAGDLGACAPACTRHSDCVMPETTCVDIGIESNGFCLYGPTECPAGPDDCAEGEACTRLPEGFFCLDERYPRN